MKHTVYLAVLALTVFFAACMHHSQSYWSAIYLASYLAIAAIHSRILTCLPLKQTPIHKFQLFGVKIAP